MTQMHVFLALAAGGLFLVLVPWLLYPAAVFALAALVRRDAAATSFVEEWPTVTCVLATRDAPDVVRERVADFLAQDYPADRLDVVVAVDSAGTLLTALGAEWPGGSSTRVRLVAGDAPGGKCASLNAAVRVARGEVLLFSDARQRFAPDVARKLVGALRADARLAITSGRLLLPADAEGSGLFRLYSRLELNLRAAEARLHSAVGVSGSIYAAWRRHWAPLPAGLILDDVYLPMRLALAGGRVGFVPDAYAYETRRVVAAQEFRRKVRTLTGNYQLCAWLPAVLVPWRNPIWLQFLCHKLLRLFLPLGVLLVGVGAAGAAARLAVGWLGAGALWVVAALALGACWIWVGRDGLARKIRGLTVQFASMQAAVAVAAFHGLRGEWDVWKA